MSQLDTIYSGVVTKTARPDRSREIKQAIIDACHEYHSLGYFGSDIKDGQIFLGARNNGTVDLRDYIPNFRALMKVTASGYGKLTRIPLLDGDLSRAGYQLAGSTLTLNPHNLATRINIHYCVTPDAENSWILQRYPDAVIALASAKVAAITANTALANALMMEVGSIFPSRFGYKHKIMMENDTYEPDL